MRQRKVFLLSGLVVVILLLPVALAAQQKMVPLSSDLYHRIDRGFILQGLAPPFNARPWSMDEFRFYFEQINADIPEELVPQSDYREPGLELAFLPSLQLEIYGKTNREGEEKYDIPWVYGFGQRAPVLELGLDVFIRDSAYLGGDVELR